VYVKEKHHERLIQRYAQVKKKVDDFVEKRFDVRRREKRNEKTAKQTGLSRTNPGQEPGGKGRQRRGKT